MNKFRFSSRALAVTLCLFASGAAKAASMQQEIQSGMQMFLQRNYAEADSAFDQALGKNPNDPLAQLWKGIAEAALKRPFASRYFLQTTDQVLGGASTNLLVIYDWSQGGIADAKEVLRTCLTTGDVRWRAGCEDLKRGIETGLSAPPVQDWPADSGLIKITKARATVWKPTAQ